MVNKGPGGRQNRTGHAPQDGHGGRGGRGGRRGGRGGRGGRGSSRGRGRGGGGPQYQDYAYYYQEQPFYYPDQPQYYAADSTYPYGGGYSHAPYVQGPGDGFVSLNGSGGFGGPTAPPYRGRGRGRGQSQSQGQGQGRGGSYLFSQPRPFTQNVPVRDVVKQVVSLPGTPQSGKSGASTPKGKGPAKSSRRIREEQQRLADQEALLDYLQNAAIISDDSEEEEEGAGLGRTPPTAVQAFKVNQVEGTPLEWLTELTRGRPGHITVEEMTTSAEVEVVDDTPGGSALFFTDIQGAGQDAKEPQEVAIVVENNPEEEEEEEGTSTPAHVVISDDEEDDYVESDEGSEDSADTDEVDEEYQQYLLDGGSATSDEEQAIQDEIELQYNRSCEVSRGEGGFALREDYSGLPGIGAYMDALARGHAMDDEETIASQGMRAFLSRRIDLDPAGGDYGEYRPSRSSDPLRASKGNKKKAEKKAARKALREQRGKQRAPGPPTPHSFSIPDMERKIRSLAEDRTMNSITLNPMPAECRAIVHSLARAFNITSKSTGGGENRCTTLTLTAQTRVVNGKVNGVVRHLCRQHPQFSGGLHAGAGYNAGGGYTKGGGRGGPSGGGGRGNGKGKGKGRQDEVPPPPKVVGGDAPALQSNNVGHRMLAKMGWAPGQSLGSKGEGIIDPVEAIMRSKGRGLGHGT